MLFLSANYNLIISWLLVRPVRLLKIFYIDNTPWMTRGTLENLHFSWRIISLEVKTRDGNDKSKQLESVDLSLVAAPLVKDPSLSRCLALSFPSLVFTSRDIILHSKCRFSRVPCVIHGVLAQSLYKSKALIIYFWLGKF